MSAAMTVGYGSVVLHVPEGVPMGGYLDRQGMSAGTLDPLEVSAVTWSDGERRFALAVADVICVNDDLAARARRAAGCELWLAATHTHAGPETGCVPGGGATPEPWLDLVAEAARAAVHRAVDSERPCEGVALGGDLRGVGADRSRPDAEAVVPLDVIAVVDGGLAGVVVVLPVHPTVLPAANRRVSADLPGAVRRALRARLGPDVWVVVATGAAGDISTRHTRRGQDTTELARLGALVADRCVDLLTGATETAGSRPEAPGSRTEAAGPTAAAVGERVWGAGSGVAAVTRRVRLERATVPADSEKLADDLRRAEAAGDPVAARLARSRLEGLRARTGYARRADDVPSEAASPTGSGTIGAEVGVARLGGLALVGLPGEPFLAVADQIAGAAPGPTVVLGYVNGYPGYLPTADAYRRTEYEVLAGQVAEGSAELLAATARRLLAEG
ncbi:hypothetical protein [Nonomuraea africana]|uniref:Alkaline ceramidase n=1 Tax=Nonomuraea africana TaxID=46171 RepID=A0ABR9KRR9_9ACTN|nr:hypothetical protein [Nonomuraea africana]MBE1564725.1 hypothetical protein [Nonomuraea africana]